MARRHSLVAAGLVLALAAVGWWWVRPSREAIGAGEASIPVATPASGQPVALAPAVTVRHGPSREAGIAPAAPEAPPIAGAVPIPEAEPPRAEAVPAVARRLRGHVVDPAGRPVEGATVWVCAASLNTFGEPPVLEDLDRSGAVAVPTDGAGAFAVTPDGPPPWCVVAAHALRAGDVRREVAGPRDGIRLVLEGPPAGSVRLRVRTPEPGPTFCGVALLLPSGEGPARFSLEAFAETWKAGGLLPGTWTLFLYPVRSPWLPVRLEVDITPDHETALEVRVEAGPVLEGVLVTADGAVLAAHELSISWEWPGIEARGRRQIAYGIDVPGDAGTVMLDTADGSLSIDCVTGLDGRFRIPGLPARAVLATVVHEGEQREFADLVPGGEPVRLVVPSGPPSLLVRVPQPAEGERRRWSVKATGVGNSGSHAYAYEAGDAIALRGLRPGRHVVSAESGSPALAWVGWVDIRAGVTTEVEVEARPGASIRVPVLAAESDAPALAPSVSVRWEGVDIGGGWSTGPDGVLGFRAPAGVALVLRVGATGREPVELPLQLAPGETRTLDPVRLARSGD